MRTPRDRDGEGFDDGRADGPAGWQEPAHLGRGADGPAEPAGPAAPVPESWQPPGWDLPAVEPERPAAPPVPAPAPAPAPAGDQTGQPIVVPPADPWGTQAWALSI